MSVYEFKQGDRVIVTDITVDHTDKKYSRNVGTVEEKAHRNGGRDVYRVLLDDYADYGRLFYDADLLPYDELAALRVQLAEAEDRVVQLKEAIKVKERDASVLPVATVVTYKDVFGPATIIKQAENVWLNVFPTSSGNTGTGTMTDRSVTEALANKNAGIRKP